MASGPGYRKPTFGTLFACCARAAAGHATAAPPIKLKKSRRFVAAFDGRQKNNHTLNLGILEANNGA
jgi:hypothetical protein